MISGDWSPGAKSLAITLDGETVSENAVSLTVTDDLNGAEDPKLGSTCAATLTLVIQDPRESYGGKTLAVSVAGIPLGVFTVTAVAAKDGRTTVTALDAMATAFEGEYTPPAAPSTALTVIRQIAGACGVTVGDVSGVTDVPVTGLKAGITCRETLGLMAALLGRNAHIDRTGKLCLRWYADSGVTITGDDYYPGDLTARDSDYAIARIECAVTRTRSVAEGDVTTEETETVVYAAGEGATGISITDDYMTQAILDGIYARIGGLTYRPMTVTFYGDARIEAGDLIRVTDGAGDTHNVPVMAVTHVWDGGVKTTVTAQGNPAQGLSVSPGGFLSKSVSNLMAEFARFKNLEAERLLATNARIDSIEAGDFHLYGLMAVYKDDTLRDQGGQLGYTSGDEWTGAGMALISNGPEPEPEPESEAPVGETGGEGQGVAVIGNNALFFGYKPPEDGPQLDGGADIPITTGDYSHYIRIYAGGVEINGRHLLREIGTLSGLNTTAKASLVAAINELMSGKVSKSGDTMSGDLTMNNVSVIIKDTNVTHNIVPSSNVYGDGILLRDSAGANIGYIRTNFMTDGKEGMFIEVMRNVGGTNIYHNLKLMIDALGNRNVSFTEPAAWRSGLGLGSIATINKGTSTTTYLRNDGAWATPPNTWRGIQNNLTSTSTTDSLSAAQGKALNDKITGLVKSATFSGTTSAYGNLNDVSSKPIIGVKAASTRLAVPYKGQSGNGWGLHFFTSGTEEAVKNTAVSGTYYYLNI